MSDAPASSSAPATSASAIVPARVMQLQPNGVLAPVVGATSGLTPAAAPSTGTADADRGDSDDSGEDDFLPVFDDCDEVRRKIRRFLLTREMTQTQLLRELGDINAGSFRTFMGYHVRTRGNEEGGRARAQRERLLRRRGHSQFDPFPTGSALCAARLASAAQPSPVVQGKLHGTGGRIYPAAYTFFERRRIAAGKKKTKRRLESEEAFGPEGRPLLPKQPRLMCRGDDYPVLDRLGRVKVVNPHTGAFHWVYGQSRPGEPEERWDSFEATMRHARDADAESEEHR